ncbi:MAG: hypothetical protein HYZ71_05335 [Deltaproteobacteria bacterium]|nr:hypothetical protein [Deltaproteobacteria bacterium]
MKQLKHDWNWLEDYLSVHEAVIGRFQQYMITSNSYSHKWFNSEYLELSISFTLRTHQGALVNVSIMKDVEVKSLVPSKGKKTGRRRARTEAYTYVAYRSGQGCLLRYCSPHDRLFDKSSDHHEFHHKHDFTSGQEIITRTGDNWPHVDDFLSEVMSRL